MTAVATRPDTGAGGGAKPRRVVVAMSGGVDSSVVAALLKREGHDVIGVTLQLYDHAAAMQRKGACCAGQDVHDARRVAQALDIPHYVLDYEERFRASVIAAFADSYIAGETPIPCVTCNQRIKFEDLLQTAQELGADALATGHYIRRDAGPRGPELYRARDSRRDQSYFLFATTREQLQRLWFPLGQLEKSLVRSIAEGLGLAVATKPDSQDICFVPTGRYSDVIERLRPGATQAGDIVDLDGRVLGRHSGIVNFTVGQRRGLEIAAREPLYVLRLDAERHRVVVGPRTQLEVTTLELRDLNWLGDADVADVAREGLGVHARIRSSAAPQPATLEVTAGGARVRLHAGEYGVAPGQACVLYADDSPTSRVLGGGWIAKAHRPANG